MGRRFKYLFLLLLTGCALVDEDLSICEKDYSMDYELRLVTNMTTEISTQVGLAADVNVSAALMAQMKNIFSDHAHDVDLSFYDAQDPEMPRLHHETHIMDANQSSYTLYIPVHAYRHIALANLESNYTKAAPQQLVLLEADDHATSARLQQPVRDTVPSHTSGLFTARMDMDILEGVDQQFNVRLYMANCASALVLDTLGSHVKKVEVFASGFATAFNLSDSTYLYQYTPVVRTSQVEVPDQPSHPLCFTCVNFPSRREPESPDKPQWYYRVYGYLEDGSITETKLGVKLPLLPGQFKIITGYIRSDGACTPAPEETYVAASVCLNWNPGMDWEVDL